MGKFVNVTMELIRIDEYPVYTPWLPESPLVIDAGARFGEFTWPFLKQCGGKVLCYEPDPKVHEKFLVNRKEHGFDKYTAPWVQKAVWDTEETAELNSNGTAGIGAPSLFSMRPRRDNELFHTVGTVSINSIIADYDAVDILKLDVEGAEFRILDSMSKDSCLKTNQIFGEMHWEYTTEWNRESLKALMEAKGYIWHVYKNNKNRSLIWMGRKELIDE